MSAAPSESPRGAALAAALPTSPPSASEASELTAVIEAVLDPLESYLFDATDAKAASELDGEIGRASCRERV